MRKGFALSRSPGRGLVPCTPISAWRETLRGARHSQEKPRQNPPWPAIQLRLAPATHILQEGIAGREMLPQQYPADLDLGAAAAGRREALQAAPLGQEGKMQPARISQVPRTAQQHLPDLVLQRDGDVLNLPRERRVPQEA